MVQHFDVIFSEFTLNGTRISFEENIAPIPTAQVGPWSFAKFCIQYGQQSEAWQPLLIKDGEAVLPNKSDKFQRPIHRCRSLFPVMLKILRSEVD